MALNTRLGLDARLTAQGDAFAGTVRVENAEPGAWDQKRLPFASASARVVTTLERVEVNDLELALVGGGRAKGNARWQKGTGVEAQLEVADVNLLALHGGLQKTQVAGRVAVSGDARAQRFEVALKDPRFEIEGRAALAGNKLDVETVRVGTGGGSVVATGSLVTDGTREFRFEGRARALRSLGVREDAQGRRELHLRHARKPFARDLGRGEGGSRAQHLLGTRRFGAGRPSPATRSALPRPTST